MLMLYWITSYCEVLLLFCLPFVHEDESWELSEVTCDDKVNLKGKKKKHLFVRHAVAHVVQIPADVVHVGVAKEDPSKVFLADSGQAFGVGEELYLKQLCLQVVHEPGGARRTADRKRHHQKLTRTEEQPQIKPLKV